MASTIELLDRLEEILKEALGQDKAREFKTTIIIRLYENTLKENEEREIPIVEEKLRERFKKELATKDDVYYIKTEMEKLRTEIEKIRNEFKKDAEEVKVELEKAKTELLKWIIGLFLAQTTFITGLVLAIIKLFTKS